ncbi:hypothetical protein SAMN06297144_2367 [Sphingomonas guangdongensis]|uniref:Uncharacterized protein n=1 Tax=Sphingomonas guangdongensis TaxID=1141890 RepID=A0A285QZ77_9SPHN|nr:hypothetical protein [Sphingomonas guangdongensis]SOB87240.1 hypothetical protein SAMN06297144_2367 [Sphingomonas guangdongensis]
MGLTLLAVVTAALLLPGIIAARAMFEAARTAEVEPVIPSLSGATGIALAGGFSVITHCLYVLALIVAAALPPWTPLPLADPYAILLAGDPAGDRLQVVLALVLGLMWLIGLATLIGFVAGRFVLRYGDPAIFYGPLAEVLLAGRGPNRFINAYVLTKVGEEGRFVGYRGTVASLLRDESRVPDRVVLKNVATFYLDIRSDGPPKRREQPETIDWLVLTAAEWYNIAFRVYEIAEDEPVS